MGLETPVVYTVNTEC